MDKPNVPDSPPRLLPGRSALRWTRLAFLASVACLLGIFSIVATSALAPGGGPRELMITVESVVAIVAILGGFAFTWKAVYREFDEMAVGYTTRFGRLFAYWQLDDRTGEVLRRPGEREVRRRTE